ncbi:hypothetical protein CC2G_011329 [Coprinopsis cinerea AmutBmut pab1-1]|nr:hypothetical protein CC2G_011329 [Coprinopsis cinerea AmutBmut pab1-1]
MVHHLIVALAPSGVAPMDSLDIQQAIINGIAFLHRFSYAQVAPLVLLVVDYLETFPLEVKHIWTADIFVHYALTFVYYESESLDCAGCYRWLVSSIMAMVFTSVFSEALIYLQVYALSGKNVVIGLWLLFQLIATYAAKLGLLSRYLKLLIMAAVGIPGIHCTPLNPNEIAPYMGAVFAVPIAPLAIIILISFWIHRRGYRGLKSSLFVVMIRNGMAYVLIILPHPYLPWRLTTAQHEKYKYNSARKWVTSLDISRRIPTPTFDPVDPSSPRGGPEESFPGELGLD